MTQEQRDELDALAQQAFGSSDLMDELGQLDDSLRSLRPGEDWGGSERMDGENGLGLGDGTGVFQDLADLDALAEQLAQSYQGSQLDDLDLEKLARQLGSDAVVDARTLQRLEKALRESGTMRRGSDGQLALTPKAMRQLGKAVLRAVADTMSGRTGRPRRPPLRRRRRAVGIDPGVGVRRHRAVGREPDDHQRAGPPGRRRRPGHDPGRRRRDPGDRGAHAGVRGAARRHLVLDGDGGPLGADEAHRAGAAHPGHAAGSAATTCS